MKQSELKNRRNIQVVMALLNRYKPIFYLLLFSIPVSMAGAGASLCAKPVRLSGSIHGHVADHCYVRPDIPSVETEPPPVNTVNTDAEIPLTAKGQNLPFPVNTVNTDTEIPDTDRPAVQPTLVNIVNTNTETSSEAPYSSPKDSTVYRIAFYNLENFFDCLHDSLKNDDDFTPQGMRGWGNAKYTRKRNNLFKVISAIDAEHPLAAIGLAEVENARVLRDLCFGTPLRYRNFDFVHFESPDPRGIDVALLYRKDLFRVDTAFVYPLIFPPDTVARTRDILYVKGRLFKNSDCIDTVHLFVNHFPSKYGGVQATDFKRAIASRLLRTALDNLVAKDTSAFILAMGDFNTEARDPVLRRLDSLPWVNLMNAADWPTKIGSHKYRENWTTIDHMILNRQSVPKLVRQKAFLFDRDFLLQPDEKYLGMKPFRTFYGARHLGGYSDHLPVYVDIRVFHSDPNLWRDKMP